MKCCSEGCEREAVESVWLRHQIGHVHDCARHVAALREWCDVVHGEPLVDGECAAVFCTGDPIGTATPTPLDGGA